MGFLEAFNRCYPPPPPRSPHTSPVVSLADKTVNKGAASIEHPFAVSCAPMRLRVARMLRDTHAAADLEIGLLPQLVACAQARGQAEVCLGPLATAEHPDALPETRLQLCHSLHNHGLILCLQLQVLQGGARVIRIALQQPSVSLPVQRRGGPHRILSASQALRGGGRRAEQMVGWK